MEYTAITIGMAVFATLMLVVGLINPQWVLMLEEKRLNTRLRVVLIYGSFFALCIFSLPLFS